MLPKLKISNGTPLGLTLEPYSLANRLAHTGMGSKKKCDEAKNLHRLPGSTCSFLNLLWWVQDLHGAWTATQQPVNKQMAFKKLPFNTAFSLINLALIWDRGKRIPPHETGI